MPIFNSLAVAFALVKKCMNPESSFDANTLAPNSILINTGEGPILSTYQRNTSIFINNQGLSFDGSFDVPPMATSLCTKQLPESDLSFKPQLIPSESYDPNHVRIKPRARDVDSYVVDKTINNAKISDDIMQKWLEQGYNEVSGIELAKNTRKRSNVLHNQGYTDQCGGGVREGIYLTYGNEEYSDSGEIRRGLNRYSKKAFGKARNTGDERLSHDICFRKFNWEQAGFVDEDGNCTLTKEMIPAGAIVIYDGGYSFNDAKKPAEQQCGHIEVSDGNGHGYSDLTTTLLSNHGRRRAPKEIWIPVLDIPS